MRFFESEMVENERGAALVIALLILGLITLIGVSALSTARVETQVAGNDRAFKNTWYEVEGTAMTAMQLLDNLCDDPAKPLQNNIPWIIDKGDLVQEMTGNPPADLIDEETRRKADQHLFDNWTVNGVVIDDTEYYAVYEGIAPGPLDSTGESRDQLYSVYGRSATASDRIMIKARFKGRW